MDTYTYGAREGGGKPLDPDFQGRFEHPHPLVIDGKEIDDSLVVVVESDRIIIRHHPSDKQLVYKILTDETYRIIYETSPDKTQAQAEVETGSWEGKTAPDGEPFTPAMHQVSQVSHIISVYFDDRHPNEQPYAQLNSKAVREVLQEVFEKHWRPPEEDTMETEEEHMDRVDHYYKEMHAFVHTTTFNRVVRKSSEVPPDPHDHPIIDHPIIPDIPVDNTKDETDGPLIGKWDLVPKDGDGGGVLPIAVGGGAALILLLMVK